MKVKTKDLKDNPHKDRRIRVRKRYEAEGTFETFAPHEVLEMILYGGVPYSDTNVMAHELIETFGSIHNVMNSNLHDLMNSGVKGMTYNAAICIHMFNSINNYLEETKAEQNFNLTNFNNAYNYFYAKIARFHDEQMFVVGLDKSYNIKKAQILARGVPDAVTFFMRNLAKFALDCGASSLIIAHNHPSNNVKPSLDDDDLTQRAIVTLGAVGVQLIDHIIIGPEKGKYYSYSADKQLLEYYKNNRAGLSNYFQTLRDKYLPEVNFENFDIPDEKDNGKIKIKEV